MRTATSSYVSRGEARLRRGLTVLAVVLAASVSASLSAPAAAVTPVPDPPGTFQTPARASANGTWGTSGPVTGTPAGTLMADGTVRPTSDPTVVVTLPQPTRDLLFGKHDTLEDPTGEQPGRWSTSTSLVGDVVTQRGATLSVTLWAVDLHDGSVVTRDLAGVASATVMGGATDAGWVLRDPAADPVERPAHLWPFDGSADRLVPITGSVVGVGPSGLLTMAASTDPAAAEGSRALVLVAEDGSTTPVAELGLWTSEMHISGVVGSGAVAWLRDGGDLGYWDPAHGVRLGSLGLGFSSLAAFGPVIPGGLLLGTCTPKVGCRTWAASEWSNGSAPFPASWPSATREGQPALAGLATADGGMFQQWVQWRPGDDTSSVIVPARRLPASVLAVVGSVGHLLTKYVVDPGYAGTAPRSVDEVRGISGRTTSLQFTSARSVLDTYSYGHEPVNPLAVSGPYSAIPEWTSAPVASPEQKLVIRRGSSVTGRIAGPVRAVAMSGPYTLFTSGEDWAITVAWSGPNGAVHALAGDATDSLAQDGSLAAFETKDGSVWIRDLARGASSTNPRRVLRVSASALGQPLFLSAGRLVHSGAGVILDLVHGTRRSIALPTCSGMSGRILLCVDGRGRAETLDTGSATSRFRIIQGVIGWAEGYEAPLLGFAGPLVFWRGALDPTGQYVARTKLAPLPAVNGTVGPPRLLGPWATYGNVTSNAASAFCWTPEWSLSEPLASWTLRMRNAAGRVVATWTGKAYDGVLRGVRWCPGSNTPGTYRWTLTGTGPTGGPVAVSGSGAAVGRVTVVRQVRAAALLTAPASAGAGTTLRLSARLVRAGTTIGIASERVELWRRIGSGSWARIAAATTNAYGRASFTSVLSTTASYQLRHVAAPDVGAAASGIHTIAAT